jgi:hypothetical protein
MSVAVRERLKTMLLLLSSDHEGERQAATAGIARVLKAPNRDFHDLALLDGPEPPPPPHPPPPAASLPILRPRGDGDTRRWRPTVEDRPDDQRADLLRPREMDTRQKTTRPRSGSTPSKLIFIGKPATDNARAASHRVSAPALSLVRSAPPPKLNLERQKEFASCHRL